MWQRCGFNRTFVFSVLHFSSACFVTLLGFTHSCVLPSGNRALQASFPKRTTVRAPCAKHITTTPFARCFSPNRPTCFRNGHWMSRPWGTLCVQGTMHRFLCQSTLWAKKVFSPIHTVSLDGRYACIPINLYDEADGLPSAFRFVFFTPRRKQKGPTRWVHPLHRCLIPLQSIPSGR